MDQSVKTRALSSLIKEVKKGKFSFKHPLQRKAGVWSREQKSLLIDSFLRNYDVDKIFVEKKDDGILYVIDGVQRLSTVISYFNNEFALSKNLENLVIDGKIINIAGKKYEKLNEEAKDILLSAELQVATLTNCTEKEIAELFRRKNNGKPLSKTQKSVVCLSEELLSEIYELLDHDFWTKTALTAGQIKNDEDRDMVLQSLALMSGYDIKGFKNEHIYGAFTNWLDNNNKSELLERFTIAIDKLDEIIPKKKKSFKKLSIPFVIYSMDKILIGNYDEEKFVEWLNNFFDTYNENEDYKSRVNISGTASKNSVLGRKEYFDKVLEGFEIENASDDVVTTVEESIVEELVSEPFEEAE